MRKVKAFYFTVIVVCVILIITMIVGVDFDGADIADIIMMICGLAGAFFGANFGEHWAGKNNNNQL